MSNTHFARNRKNPFNARLSAKNTALSHDAPKPTTDMPSAAAPNELTESESDTRPSSNPYTAAAPGRKRTEPRSSATMVKSIDARQASRGRSVYCKTIRIAQTRAVRAAPVQFMGEACEWNRGEACHV